MGLTQMFYKEGVQQGVQQGIYKGEIVTLKRLFIQRFGSLPDYRLNKADSKDLEKWIDRILNAGSIEDILLN